MTVTTEVHFRQPYADRCPFEKKGVVCPEGERDCAHCGWNPAVKPRRIDRAREKLRAGVFTPPAVGIGERYRTVRFANANREYYAAHREELCEKKRRSPSQPDG